MNMFLEIFQYGFVLRAFEAGIVVAAIAPLIGIFLVLKRYSLIADTFSHVSLAGIAAGFLMGINPVLSALVFTVIASFGIEKLRGSKKVYGESALAIFLSGALALAVVIISLAHGFNTNLYNYLFGSIVTITSFDVYMISALAAVVATVLILFYKEIVYISFDEESAKASGIPVKMINGILILLTAITVSMAIPTIGVLLISALIVIPVVAALQLRQSFLKTIFFAQAISVFSVASGRFASFYFNISTGGTIVLIMLAIFLVVFLWNRGKI